MKGERNHLVDQVHAKRAAEAAAAEARKNLPPVERVRAGKEHLAELQKINEAKIKLQGRMEILGKAFRDMGVAKLLLDAMDVVIAKAPSTADLRGFNNIALESNEKNFKSAADAIEIISQMIDKLASTPEEGRHFEFRQLRQDDLCLMLVEDGHTNLTELVRRESEDKEKNGEVLTIKLKNIPWDSSTPEGLALINGMEEAFPKLAGLINEDEKIEREIKEIRAERKGENEKEEAAAAVAAEEARVKAVKDAKTKARIAKLQKELKGE